MVAHLVEVGVAVVSCLDWRVKHSAEGFLNWREVVFVKHSAGGFLN